MKKEMTDSELRASSKSTQELVDKMVSVGFNAQRVGQNSIRVDYWRKLSENELNESVKALTDLEIIQDSFGNGKYELICYQNRS